jgi:tetratricopeptide (TPR) repeat protein
MSEPPSESGFTYRAFLSYSHADKAWADWLHKALETYRVPSHLVGKRSQVGVIPRRLHPIFRDRAELASSTDLGDTINEALAKSGALVVICSPRSAQSRWVNEEVLAFKRWGRADRIFCLIVDGEPTVGDTPGCAAEECFSPALRCTFSENAPTNRRTEPVAADVRPGQDGKLNAKLKLIAGLLGVGFDQLKQREQHRRMQRMVAVTSLTLAVMAVTAVSAVFALISRHDAVVAQHQAEVAQHAAERRQKRAEDLIGYMLGDLNDKLQQVSRLDIVEAVDDRALAYFKSLPATDVTDDTLGHRAKALEKIGEVRMTQGQLAEALDAFQTSSRISARLANAAPGDAERQAAHARVLSYVGMIYWNQGKLAAAQQSFESAQEILLRARPRSGQGLSLKYARLNAANNLAHVLETRGHPDAALTAYRNTLTLARELVAANPDNADWMSALGDAHNNLGKLALVRGDLAEAVTEYLADDAIKTRLSARAPRDNSQREDMLRVRAILGRTLAMTGDTATGMRYLQQAVDLAGQLVKFDPDNTDFLDLAALYSTQLARLKRLDGNLPEASVLNAKSLTTLSTLISKDPSNSAWQSDYAVARIEQAAQSRATGNRGAALAQARSALKILDPMLSTQPDDHATLLSTLTAKLLLADATTDPTTAQTLREQALQLLQALETGKNDPRLLALQVYALLALDRRVDAQATIKFLWNSGYRDLELMGTLQRADIDYPPNPEFQARLLAASVRSSGTGVTPPAAQQRPQSSPFPNQRR